MRITATLALLSLAAAAAAQGTSITPVSKMGVFAQGSGKPSKFSTLGNSRSVTTTQSLGVVADTTKDDGSVMEHARSKASVRMIEGLPALRIYEAGSISSSPNSTSRAVGTCGASTKVGTTSKPHAWLIRHTGTPGDTVRVHIRLRSNLANSGLITGGARVNVNNDASVEFDQSLNGKRFLSDHPAVIGSNGILEVKVETHALLTSSSTSPSSYMMALDVSFEPTQGLVASFSPFGALCGADLYGIAWCQNQQRFARLVMDNAPPNAPAFGLFGLGRINIPIPGAACSLLTTADVILPTRTDLVGRVIADLPPVAETSFHDLTIQFATLTPARIEFSKGIRFVARMASTRPYDHFDINHVLSGGQSLAMGGLGAPVLSQSQKYNNLMFDNGLRGQSTNLSPLVENFWETMSSGMSNTISELHSTQVNNNGTAPVKSHDVLVSIHAEPGYAYSQVKRGTQAFTNGMNQQRLAQYIADSQRKSYITRCVTVVHGEEDHQRVNNNYAQDLIQWQRDYEREIQARGQTEPVPMMHTQMSSFTSFVTSWSFIPTEQLKACVINPRKNVMVGPKYIFDYLDGVHLQNKAYRRMGEYYGKVYSHIFLEGGTWEPLRPLHIKRDGAVITVRFHVPEPPLVLDTWTVKNPGDFGFDYSDTSGSAPTIQFVRLIDEDTVEIQLSAVPQASASKYLGYAYFGTPGASAGPISGARGNLRDSDPTPSLYSQSLHNWCVHFRETFK